MKSSELKKLVEQYKSLKLKMTHDQKAQEKLKEMEHRYYHETGQSLESYLGSETTHKKPR
jgi:hypothetical protein